MIVLDLPPKVEQYITQTARHQGVSINELIIQWADKEIERSMLLTDVIKSLPNRSNIGDGLAIQKALRDEWD